MHLTRRIWIQLAVVAVVATAGVFIVFIPFVKVPERWFGLGQYTVTADLPAAACQPNAR